MSSSTAHPATSSSTNPFDLLRKLKRPPKPPAPARTKPPSPATPTKPPSTAESRSKSGDTENNTPTSPINVPKPPPAAPTKPSSSPKALPAPKASPIARAAAVITLDKPPTTADSSPKPSKRKVPSTASPTPATPQKRNKSAQPPPTVASGPNALPHRPLSSVPTRASAQANGIPTVTKVDTSDPASIGVATSESLDMTLVALQPDQALPFLGACYVCPLIGLFSAHGYRFKAVPELAKQLRQVVAQTNKSPSGEIPASVTLHFYPCFSPRTSSAVVIASVTTKTAAEDPYAFHCGSTVVDVEFTELARLLGKLDLKKGCAVLALKPVAESGVLSAEATLPTFRDIFCSRDGKENRFELPNFLPVLDNSSPILTLPPDWKNAIVKVLSRENPIALTFGAKGVGKSTFSRFLLNQLLCRYREVAYLDCDLGQPEFTPIGLVSLNIVTAPIIGPSFTHLKRPAHSLFIGANSPKDEPDYYVSSVLHLFQIYQSRYASTMPLVINTQGWIKGMGYDLLAHMLSVMQPNILIGLAPPSQSLASGLSDLFSFVSNGGCKFVEIPSAAEMISKYTAADLRSLGIISYFAQRDADRPYNWSERWSINFKTPFQVALSRIRLKCIGGEVPTSETLRAVNGTIVGLVVDETEYEEVGFPEFLPSGARTAQIRVVSPRAGPPLDPQKSNCVGLGVVRAVDLDTDSLFLVTPVSLDVLRDVNLLVRSAGIEMPPSLWVNGLEAVGGDRPYTTFSVAEGFGSVAARRMRHLQRRKLASK
ncbi:Pre-mRNA cleavage complex II protein Clp1-domain-containing protein [Zopfochytrium polystomum]|nr:Pre-mRNA cleavage complex II protein Clp1-domain-containing protein [Zopfochytrium polystomum]